MSAGLIEPDIAILDCLASDAQPISQRELARQTGYSLGKINYTLRALVDKGWVKMGNFRRNPSKLRYAYLLTPKGIEAKSKLTREFLAKKLREYDALKGEIQRLKQQLGEDA